MIASGAELVPEHELPTCGAFLAKPFSAAKLVATIERLDAALDRAMGIPSA